MFLNSISKDNLEKEKFFNDYNQSLHKRAAKSMQKALDDFKIEDFKFQKSPRHYLSPTFKDQDLRLKEILETNSRSPRQNISKLSENPHFFLNNQSKSESTLKHRTDPPKHLSPTPMFPSDLFNLNMTSIKNRLKLVQSPEPFSTKSITLPKLEKKSQPIIKKTVVIDLDETLIHASPTTKKPDHIITKILPDGSSLCLKVSIRPYAKEFIRTVAYFAEVIIFTASVKTYADPIIDLLDPLRELIKLRLYRESCQMTSLGYIKDLSILKKPLKDILIIDNLASSFAKQRENGILITSWYGDPNDTELLKLCKNIKRILSYEDLRKSDKNFQIIY